ncbi:MAG: hypothetical protein ACJAT2_000402 [Bacteriovoracaceae bacterium]|jgi:hypothetical protein
MKVAILFILMALVVSCGNSGRKPSTESQLGSALVAGGVFGPNEKNTAIKICYAFRSKNTNYRASFLNSTFSFNLSYRDCDGEDKNELLGTILKAPLSSQPMVFDAISEIPFYNNVQTDKEGVLKDICSSLLDGGNPSRSNLSFGRLVEISFLSSSVDKMIVRSAGLVGSDYVIDQEERFEVDSTAGNRTGQIKFASREKTCANGRVESMTQQLITQ